MRTFHLGLVTSGFRTLGWAAGLAGVLAAACGPSGSTDDGASSGNTNNTSGSSGGQVTGSSTSGVVGSGTTGGSTAAGSNQGSGDSSWVRSSSGGPGTSGSGATSGTGPCGINGLIICNGECVNPLTDILFCGATGDCEGTNGGAQCLGGKTCVNGRCGMDCPEGSGRILCGDTCVDPLVSTTYCGASGDCLGSNDGQTCGSGQTCSAGVCGNNCEETELLCGGETQFEVPLTVVAKNNSTVTGTGMFTRVAAGPLRLALTVTAPVSFNGRTVKVALTQPTTPATGCNGVAGTSAGPVALELGTYTYTAGGLSIDEAFPSLTVGGGGSNDIVNKALVIVSALPPTSPDSGTATHRNACAVIGAGSTTTAPLMCVDPNTSDNYCGAVGDCQGFNAGEACTGGSHCEEGVCVAPCGSGEIQCFGTCIDPMVNNTYCGATLGCGTGSGSVGVTCGSGQQCVEGTCSQPCAPGFISCAGNCVDPRTDSMFCGAYGECTAGGNQVGVVCPAGSQCNGEGVCTRRCLPGFTLHNGRCVNPDVDNEACGAALVNCAEGSLCSDGTCRVGACAAGYAMVGGHCYDPISDPRYCGTVSVGEECTFEQECNVLGNCVTSTRTFVGALSERVGHWEYQVPGTSETGIGYSSGLAMCKHFYEPTAGSSESYDVGICNYAQFVSAETRGDLVDAVDYAGNMVTGSWWVDDPASRAAARDAAAGSAERNAVCYSDNETGMAGNVRANPNREAWTYASGDLQYHGTFAAVEALGGIGPVTTPPQGAGNADNICNHMRFVGCCLQ